MYASRHLANIETELPAQTRFLQDVVIENNTGSNAKFRQQCTNSHTKCASVNMQLVSCSLTCNYRNDSVIIVLKQA